MTVGVKYCISTHARELAFYNWGEWRCVGIKVPHEEHQLVLGVKQLKHSIQLQKGSCLTGQQSSLHKVVPMWAGQGWEIYSFSYLLYVNCLHVLYQW